jgi:CRISPR/Cas system-associated exonuclease Cas4 (RecB family)
MTVYLYPTLRTELTCPSRYTRSKVRREPIPAPFASSIYGKVAHQRIAQSLCLGKPPDHVPIALPARVMLNDGEDLEALSDRAMDSLHYWEQKCLPWLEQLEVLAVEHRTVWSLERHSKRVRFSGVLDLIVRTPKGQLIVDWKTGSLQGAQEQLAFYLILHYQETGCCGLQAEAISLSSGEVEGIHWQPEYEGWVLSQLDEMLGALETIQAHPDKVMPGPHCRYCPYAHDCPASCAGQRRVVSTRTGEIMTLC